MSVDTAPRLRRVGGLALLHQLRSARPRRVARPVPVVPLMSLVPVPEAPIVEPEVPELVLPVPDVEEPLVPEPLFDTPLPLVLPVLPLLVPLLEPVPLAPVLLVPLLAPVPLVPLVPPVAALLLPPAPVDPPAAPPWARAKPMAEASAAAVASAVRLFLVAFMVIPLRWLETSPANRPAAFQLREATFEGRGWLAEAFVGLSFSSAAPLHLSGSGPCRVRGFLTPAIDLQRRVRALATDGNVIQRVGRASGRYVHVRHP